MSIRNKDEGNSISSRLAYIGKQLNDPRRSEKEIKVLKLREKNLLDMLSDDQESFKDGGMNDVPSKYKGFSNLPEGVQQKIDPKLAKKYKTGGMSKAVLKARGGTFKGTF
tara:strand:- start:311 stop:640 length:330 start_codon:yes stop_codon:yes gene_type:complete